MTQKFVKEFIAKNSLKNSLQKIRLTIYCAYDAETVATKKNEKLAKMCS